MTAFDYSGVNQTASRLIAKFGQAAMLRRTEVDTSSGDWEPAFAIADYDCTVAILEFGLTKVDGTLVKSTDRMAYLATEGLAVEPQVGDKLVVGLIEHAIVSIKPLAPSGAVVFYELQVRA